MRIYIYHSADYGITFEVFHPFAKGNEPVLANFSTVTQEGNQPLEVEFCNYSIGNISEYQWDFENDGVIDSYEESPIHIYQDTGYYSVRLTTVGPDSSNTFIKENYIHVLDTTTNLVLNRYTPEKVLIFPNPFSDRLTIHFIESLKTNRSITIYNSKGEIVNEIISNSETIYWNGYDYGGIKCLPGIYFLHFEDKVYKVILNK